MSPSESPPANPRIILTIAGSDSSGGAGIQADLAVFHALGMHGASAVTAVTAQNSKGVHQLHPVPVQVVAAQIQALFEDATPAAVKTGMLVSADVVHQVAEILSAKETPNLVIDPVITSTSGHSLLSDAGVDALRRELIPIATVVTPNYAEVERLTGIAIRNDDDVVTAGQRLLECGCVSVVITGGHRKDSPKDVLLDQNGGIYWLEGEFAGPDIHGTGCVFSAALAAYLAMDLRRLQAVRQAKQFVTSAIANHFLYSRDFRVLNILLP